MVLSVLLVLIKEYPTYTTQGKMLTTYQMHLNQWIIAGAGKMSIIIILWEGLWDACWIQKQFSKCAKSQKLVR